MVQFAQPVITAHNTLTTLGLLSLSKLIMMLVMLLLLVLKLQSLVLQELTTVVLDLSFPKTVLLALTNISAKDTEIQLELLAVMDGTVWEVKRSQSLKARSVLLDSTALVVTPSPVLMAHIRTELDKLVA
jgi:hypothetical protein